MITPLIWLAIAVILIIIEALSFNLFTIWFALGAIVAMFISIPFPHNYLLQGAVFVIVSTIMLIMIRNIAVKKLKSKTIKTNVNSLIGKKAVVTKTIHPYEYGQVKVNGNYWTAKPENEETLEEGIIVEIVEVSGVKVIVRSV